MEHNIYVVTATLKLSIRTDTLDDYRIALFDISSCQYIQVPCGLLIDRHCLMHTMKSTVLVPSLRSVWSGVEHRLASSARLPPSASVHTTSDYLHPPAWLPSPSLLLRRRSLPKRSSTSFRLPLLRPAPSSTTPSFITTRRTSASLSSRVSKALIRQRSRRAMSTLLKGKAS